MNKTMIARPPLNGQQIVTQHGADVLTLPMFDVNPGYHDGKTVPAQVGDRYVLIYRQGPFDSPFMREHLVADRIAPSDPGLLGTNPEKGRQWGWEDEDDPQFVFTVVGVYILDEITPDVATQTFAASFHRAPQEVTA